jgi:trehalose 6-phosphate phosphatase
MFAVTHDPLPPFRNAALLLDLDGTLLDLAATPESVVVPPGLADALRIIKDQLGGALAVVTGRTIETIDALLSDVPHAVAGEHGGAVRSGPGAAIERPELKAPPQSWIDRGAMLATAHPGCRFEQKPRGFGLHFRLAPGSGPAIEEALADMVADSEDFHLLRGQMMWEVRPRGVDKGHAVERLMQHPPFLGRLPVFIGDDVTDEDGIRVARAMGGAGLWVPDVFGSAGGVRAWLQATASHGDWGTLP